jgi:nucleoid DNA-binding protein
VRKRIHYLDPDPGVADWLAHVADLAAAGMEVRVRGFGTFRRATRNKRVVRHPKTRELMRLERTVTLQFRAAGAVRERVR